MASGPVVNDIFLFNIPEAQDGDHPQGGNHEEVDAHPGVTPNLGVIVEKDISGMGAFLRSIGYQDLNLNKKQSRRALDGFNGHHEVIDRVEGYELVGKDGAVSNPLSESSGGDPEYLPFVDLQDNPYGQQMVRSPRPPLSG